MRFSRDEADVWVPAGGDAAAALARVTHLCIGAHQDDIEIMAHSAICTCLDEPDRFAFGGVVVTDGAGAARSGPYAGKSNDELKAIRREEQREAARLGGYAIQIQLQHPTAVVKDSGAAGVIGDLRTILETAQAHTVFLHNPMDKHDTHIAVFLRCLAALRALAPDRRPQRVLGVEVWRGLDWLLDADKVALDDSRRPELRAQLLEVFDSQIFGGKRYDLATEGRRFANATYDNAHEKDERRAVTWAMDLTPLVQDVTRDVAAFTGGYVDRLRGDIAARLARFQ